ncbi:anti-sigma factor antagonist [Candidatus Peribacteria bacterium]|jgi:anti-sigma B factor antagonist|nr:anti-sigma factor antagonist [Candidatus Peribacteria bacterium]MBT4020760.1 anti-sigma factor antagonist [Candidatus Peribacteria bacterium]MBT4241041.1 anti-sigma factor antagonist [Candidatus Peribacteria bacterium]MBT4474461.1 anti-sigma factor antagonist [Candidatus Peribacteria bacterium]
MKETAELQVEDVDGVTVVTPAAEQLTNETLILHAGERLFALVEKDGKRKVLIDFSVIQQTSSVFIGKLMTLQKKLERVTSSAKNLKLCGISEDVYAGLFKATKLYLTFDIHENREVALLEF